MLPPSPMLLQPHYGSDDQHASEEIDWANLVLDGSINITAQCHHQNPQILSPHASARAVDGNDSKKRTKEEDNKFPGKYQDKRSLAIRRGSKKAAAPRIAFQTRSAEDVLDDGYRWRKYGQKSVKNSAHPRSYYRCTHHTCNVKKQIQRQSKDPSVVVTTYEGNHNHPCDKLMQTLSLLLKQIQFLSRF